MPTVTHIAPAFPLVASPVAMETLPLLPLLVVPVANRKAPLTPLCPASAVARSMSPDDRSVE